MHERERLRVKLPKLRIEKFSGDPKRCCALRDAFDLTENDNNELSDVEKFTYLWNYLAGDVLTLQTGLALTGSNYKVELNLIW